MQSILRTQKDDVVSILDLRQAQRWREDGVVETAEAWESAFRKRVGPEPIRRRGQRSRFHAAARAENTPRSAAQSP